MLILSFIKQVWCTNIILGIEAVKIQSSKKIITISSLYRVYCILFRGRVVGGNKKRQWLSQFNRREQAKTSTRTNIKGICIEEGKETNWAWHMRKLPCTWPSLHRAIALRKAILRMDLDVGRNDAKKDATIVILWLPSFSLPIPYSFGACISTLKMRE